MEPVHDTVAGIGIPGRPSAESAIAELIGRGEFGFVLAVLATAVQGINETDGYQAGDRVLAAMAARLAGPAGGSRELFRWSANSFVIVSRSLRKVTGTADVEGSATALFAAWPDEEPRALITRIDHYISSHLACFEAA